MSKKVLITHFLIYYTAWFVCIILAAKHYPWVSLLVAVVVLLAQYCLQHIIAKTQGLLFFISLLTFFGFLGDTTFSYTGVVLFKANPFFPPLAPPWMIGLWLNFSAFFHASLKQYFNYYKLLGFLSLLGFPMAYFAGARLGAAIFPHTFSSIMVIGIFWCLVLPVATYCYQQVYKVA